MAYEGMRSVSGPYLASLGATALVVGLVTGAGEAIALVLRLFSGRWADRWGRHWTLTTLGYAMTAVCVPMLALAPLLGGAGLTVAAVLILLERTGKAVRSPSKSVLLADAAAGVGRGKGFAVHKALDQVGAFAGPLVVAAAIAAFSSTALGLAVLAVPGALAMLVLAAVARHTAHDAVGQAARPVSAPPSSAPTAPSPADSPKRLPRDFWLLAAAVAASTAGLMTYGVIGFHLVEADLVGDAGVPVVYAGAMAVAALGALASGWAYDRWHTRVLHVLAPLAAVVPPLVFTDSLALALVGVTAWGLASGIQDSSVKAAVADLVPRARLGGAYGSFAAVQGVAALVGGGAAGALYADHLTTLVVGVVLLQVFAAAALFRVLGAAPDPRAG
ncbi:MFS transporter [Nocardioides daphniae]|nr:MFS transporter [Nocardioides daphniae]